MSLVDFVKKASKMFGDTKDPVCGMRVNLDQAPFKSAYQSVTYGFCSQECKQTFDKNPHQYA